ncbi:hypothetical protein [Selenomonas sp. F0473]|nr:hypothetical protein [Selenomonas sp. F0473]
MSPTSYRLLYPAMIRSAADTRIALTSRYYTAKKYIRQYPK